MRFAVVLAVASRSAALINLAQTLPASLSMTPTLAAPTLQTDTGLPARPATEPTIPRQPAAPHAVAEEWGKVTTADSTAHASTLSYTVGSPSAHTVTAGQPSLAVPSVAPTSSATSISSTVPPPSVTESTTSLTTATSPALSGLPAAPAGFQNVFISADAFNYSTGWNVSTFPVPGCIISGHVHETFTVGSSFSFNFTGDKLFLNTLASPTGGLLSVSINGGEPELFDTRSSGDTCQLFALDVNPLVARSLRDQGTTNAAENICSGKSASGKPGVDGATYHMQTSAAPRAAATSTTSSAGITLLFAFGAVAILGAIA